VLWILDPISGAFGPDVLEDESGDEDSTRDYNDTIADVIEIDIGSGALEDAVEKSKRNLQPGITDPFAPFSVSAFGLLEC
jgi:hypothetical protein